MLLTNGYSPGSFLTWADRRGILRKMWRTDSFNSRKVIGGTRVNCVALRIQPDEPEQTDQSPLIPVQDDDLPF